MRNSNNKLCEWCFGMLFYGTDDYLKSLNICKSFIVTRKWDYTQFLNISSNLSFILNYFHGWFKYLLLFIFEFQKVEAIEEAFSCVLVHNIENEAAKIAQWQQELTNIISELSNEQQEIAVRQFLILTATMTNHSKLQMLLSMLKTLVTGGTLQAR